MTTDTMKKFELYVILAGIVPALMACRVEEENLSGKERVLMTFTAGESAGAETRTTIDGTDVLWTEGDRISIFDGSGNNCFSLICLPLMLKYLVNQFQRLFIIKWPYIKLYKIMQSS